MLWQQFQRILQWLAEPMGCDELELHQTIDPDI